MQKQEKNVKFSLQVILIDFTKNVKESQLSFVTDYILKYLQQSGADFRVCLQYSIAFDCQFEFSCPTSNAAAI